MSEHITYLLKLIFISIVNIVRVLYLPIALAHSLILYLLLLEEAPFEDIEYYFYLFRKTTREFVK